MPLQGCWEEETDDEQGHGLRSSEESRYSVLMRQRAAMAVAQFAGMEQPLAAVSGLGRPHPLSLHLSFCSCGVAGCWARSPGNASNSAHLGAAGGTESHSQVLGVPLHPPEEGLGLQRAIPEPHVGCPPGTLCPAESSPEGRALGSLPNLLNEERQVALCHLSLENSDSSFLLSLSSSFFSENRRSHLLTPKPFQC